MSDSHGTPDAPDPLRIGNGLVSDGNPRDPDISVTAAGARENSEKHAAQPAATVSPESLATPGLEDDAME